MVSRLEARGARRAPASESSSSIPPCATASRRPRRQSEPGREARDRPATCAPRRRHHRGGLPDRLEGRLRRRGGDRRDRGRVARLRSGAGHRRRHPVMLGGGEGRRGAAHAHLHLDQRDSRDCRIRKSPDEVDRGEPRCRRSSPVSLRVGHPRRVLLPSDADRLGLGSTGTVGGWTQGGPFRSAWGACCLYVSSCSVFRGGQPLRGQRGRSQISRPSRQQS